VLVLLSLGTAPAASRPTRPGPAGELRGHRAPRSPGPNGLLRSTPASATARAASAGPGGAL